MSIITYPLNGITYDAEDVGTYLCTRTSGVYARDSNFAVSISGAREITIAPGLAWINYDDFKGVSVCSREATRLPVPDADSNLPRIDRVVLQFDVDANSSTFKIKPGTPAAEPEPPAIQQNHRQYELGLCTIAVAVGRATITAADITDTRTDESVCGIMRDGVTGIPTEELLARWNEAQAQQEADARKAADTLLRNIQQQADTLLGSYTGGYLASASLTLAPADWAACDGGYPYSCTAALALCQADHVPVAAFAAGSVSAASKAGVAPVCEALDGGVRFYAAAKPDAALTVQVSLLGPQKGA